MRVAVRQQTLGAPLATDAALFVSAEDGLGCGFLPGVDENGAGFKAFGDGFGTGYVLACGEEVSEARWLVGRGKRK